VERTVADDVTARKGTTRSCHVEASGDRNAGAGVLSAPAWADDKKEPPEKNEAERSSASSRRRKRNWIEVLADGEEKARRYTRSGSAACRRTAADSTRRSWRHSPGEDRHAHQAGVGVRGAAQRPSRSRCSRSLRKRPERTSKSHWRNASKGRLRFRAPDAMSEQNRLQAELQQEVGRPLAQLGANTWPVLREMGVDLTAFPDAEPGGSRDRAARRWRRNPICTSTRTRITERSSTFSREPLASALLPSFSPLPGFAGTRGFGGEGGSEFKRETVNEDPHPQPLSPQSGERGARARSPEARG